MRIKNRLLTGVLGILTLLPTLRAYEAPTVSQIDNMLANPKLLVQLLDDADGKEAAVLVNRIIERIMAKDISEKQKNYLIAFYTGQIAILLGKTDAADFARELVSIAPTESLSIIFAGLSVGRGGDSDFLALLKELGGENQNLLTAINTPNVSLTDPVYNLLVANIGNNQSVPPSATDSIPPPGDGAGDGDAAPPPAPPVVPAPYNGQG